jgi:hypothetical protein
LGVSPGKRWHWGRCWARRKKWDADRLDWCVFTIIHWSW